MEEKRSNKAYSGSITLYHGKDGDSSTIILRDKNTNAGIIIGLSDLVLINEPISPDIITTIRTATDNDTMGINAAEKLYVGLFSRHVITMTLHEEDIPANDIMDTVMKVRTMTSMAATLATAINNSSPVHMTAMMRPPQYSTMRVHTDQILIYDAPRQKLSEICVNNYIGRDVGSNYYLYNGRKITPDDLSTIMKQISAIAEFIAKKINSIITRQ